MAPGHHPSRDSNAPVGLPLFLREQNRKVETEPLEREADVAAGRMLSGLSANVSRGSAGRMRPHLAATSAHEVEGAPEGIRDVVSTGGQPLSTADRSYFEPRLGLDLGHVRIHTGSAADASARAMDALAYTYGPDIVFRDGVVAPNASKGRDVLAHELAHVAQQGERPTLVQRFGHSGHRVAIAAGLSPAFGHEEIGDIYVANWERDFAQGAPEYADLVIAWKEVKQAALEDGEGSARFIYASWNLRDAVQRVLDLSLLFGQNVLSESMGGARFWEHMDDTEELEAYAAQAEMKVPAYFRVPGTRPGHGAGEVPLNVRISLAYLKDEMIKAVESYREKASLPPMGLTFDTWGELEQPMDYGQPKDVKDPQLSRGVVAKESSDLAKEGVKNPVARQLPGGPAAFADAAQRLGRATHAIEDFFAHSNWLELAREISLGLASVPDADIQSTVYDVASGLTTGTFGFADKGHSLGHKLVGLVRSMKADFPLLLKAFGRHAASAELDASLVRRGVIGPLETVSSTLAGDFIDLAWARSNTIDAVSRRQISMAETRPFIGVPSVRVLPQLEIADIITNHRWLDALEAKGMALIKHGDEASEQTSHGKLAKDQMEESAPHKDFNSAQLLAAAADMLIIAPLVDAMRAPDPVVAQDIVKAQLMAADALITVPHRDHPLLPLVQPK